MGKLKASWVITDIPKNTKIKLWRLMKDNPTYQSWEKAIVGKSHTTEQDEIFTNVELGYIKMSKDTYSSLKKELTLMPVEEVDTLPHDLKIWIYSIRQDLKLEKSVEPQLKERTLDPQLTKHLDDLAQTAKILAHRVERLLRYKDTADMQGNVVSGVRLWSKIDGQVVPDWLKESIYDAEHQVDPYLATCLFAHYEDEFGKPPFKEWNQLSTGNVSYEIVDNLKFLAHGGIKPCQDCPICLKK